MLKLMLPNRRFYSTSSLRQSVPLCKSRFRPPTPYSELRSPQFQLIALHSVTAYSSISVSRLLQNPAARESSIAGRTEKISPSAANSLDSVTMGDRAPLRPVRTLRMHLHPSDAPCRQTGINRRMMFWYALGVLLCVHTRMLAWMAYRYSPTIDEPAALAACLSQSKIVRFDPYRVNSPPIRLVASVPFLPVDPRTDWNWLAGSESAIDFEGAISILSADHRANGVHDDARRVGQ
jgi:hypothetical protein